MIEDARKSIEDPEKFLSGNKEVLEQYLEFQQSGEYKNPPACRTQNMLKEFNSASGYYDVFIPAMIQLSPSYAKYYKQLETANEKLLSLYPEIEELNNSYTMTVPTGAYNKSFEIEKKVWIIIPVTIYAKHCVY